MSDPRLLDVFRKQCQTLRKNGQSAYLALLAWDGQPGVERDDLIDICKEIESEASA